MASGLTQSRSPGSSVIRGVDLHRRRGEARAIKSVLFTVVYVVCSLPRPTCHRGSGWARVSTQARTTIDRQRQGEERISWHMAATRVTQSWNHLQGPFFCYTKQQHDNLSSLHYTTLPYLAIDRQITKSLSTAQLIFLLKHDG